MVYVGIMFNIEALKLACRFSLRPNQLGYCGKESAERKFRDCIIKGKVKGLKKEFDQFIVLNPYLSMLSKVLKFDKFDYKVVESYWLGNEELKKVKADDYDLLLENFRKQGVPEWLVEELKQKRPKEFIPTHLFQVLHVGVGRASGAVPFNIESVNNCMVRWGKIKSKLKNQKSKIKIELNSLEKRENKYKLIKKEETVRWDAELVPDLKVGQTVAVHWGWVAKKLTSEEQEKLLFWTQKVLETAEARD